MRVVLDTNIFVSGLLSAVGPPARIVQAVLQRRLVPVMSAATFSELDTVVHRPKLQPAFTRAGVNVENFLATVRAEAQFVDPVPPAPPSATSVIAHSLICLPRNRRPTISSLGTKISRPSTTAASRSSRLSSLLACSDADNLTPAKSHTLPRRGSHETMGDAALHHWSTYLAVAQVLATSTNMPTRAVYLSADSPHPPNLCPAEAAVG